MDFFCILYNIPKNSQVHIFIRCLSYRLIKIHRKFTRAYILCDKATLISIYLQNTTRDEERCSAFEASRIPAFNEGRFTRRKPWWGYRSDWSSESVHTNYERSDTRLYLVRRTVECSMTLINDTVVRKDLETLLQWHVDGYLTKNLQWMIPR
jgi:hypothetical protein